METVNTLVAVTLFLNGFVEVNVDAFRHFQGRLPNGGIVPHPCRRGSTWEAVGHINAEGGAARNRFGEDFYKNGMKWDRCICERDSDGDGRSNGEELGDPDCEWKEGDANPIVSPDMLSHPGICEPFNDTSCLATNDWNVCAHTSPSQFTEGCPAVNQPEVIAKELKFPEVDIPAQRSTYKCQSFEVPTERDYHIVGAQPIIHNPDLVHHMVVIGCENEDNLPDTEPVDCSSLANKCKKRTWLMIWRLGTPGYCAGDEFGFKIGLNGFKRVILAIHWKNAEAEANLRDSSGLKIFYTPNLRKNDAAMLSVGLSAYELPEGLQLLDVEAKCTSKCTGRIQNENNEITLADGILHKYYLGDPAAVLSKKDEDGGNEATLITSSSYEYDFVKKFDPKVTLGANEQLETTSGAMADANAYSLLTYYPASGLNFCMQYKGMDICQYPDKEHMKTETFGNCDLQKFFQLLQINFNDLKTKCTDTCTDDCQMKIDQIKDLEPCLQGTESDFLEKVILGTSTEADKEFFPLLRTCDISEGEDDAPAGGAGDDSPQITPSPSPNPSDEAQARPCVFTEAISTADEQSKSQVMLVMSLSIISLLYRLLG